MGPRRAHSIAKHHPRQMIDKDKMWLVSKDTMDFLWVYCADHDNVSYVPRNALSLLACHTAYTTVNSTD